jgi:mRNA interferase RelE/StbE
VGRIGTRLVYTLLFDVRAKKEFAKIPRPYQITIKRKLEILAKSPEALKNNIKQLKSNYNNLFRLLVGSYRVIYQLKNNTMVILILRIGQRKSIYD